MKFRLHTPIPHTIDAQLKHQSRTLYPHIEREIQIVKLDTLRCRQAREQALRHRVEVRGKCTHIDESLAEGVWCGFGVAGNEVVFDDEGLAGAEVACIVERYWG